LWSDADEVVFDTFAGGWARVPRTIPMIASLLDTASFGGKESPGRVYQVLWCHEFGDGFVDIVDPSLLALEAGYITTRAERTFQERLRTLIRLGFIRSAPMGLRESAFVLLLDPHRVLATIRSATPDRISNGWWSAFEVRCANAGIPLTTTRPAKARAHVQLVDDDDDDDDDPRKSPRTPKKRVALPEPEAD